MKRISTFLLSLLANSVDVLVQDVIDEAVKDLETEINKSVTDPQQQEAVKATIQLFIARISVLLRQKLSGGV